MKFVLKLLRNVSLCDGAAARVGVRVRVGPPRAGLHRGGRPLLLGTQRLLSARQWIHEPGTAHLLSFPPSLQYRHEHILKEKKTQVEEERKEEDIRRMEIVKLKYKHNLIK